MKINTQKPFDAIAFKRAAALQLHEKLKNMRPEQERRYWQRRNREFAKQFAAAAAAKTKRPAGLKRNGRAAAPLALTNRALRFL